MRPAVVGESRFELWVSYSDNCIGCQREAKSWYASIEQNTRGQNIVKENVENTQTRIKIFSPPLRLAKL